MCTEWLTKFLHTTKIALYQNQLEHLYSDEELEKIHNLATSLAVFYTKSWLTATNTRDAPSNDLKLLRKLSDTEERIDKNTKQWPSCFLQFVQNAHEKSENQLWDLSKQLVFFSLFSDNISQSEKQLLRRAVIKYQKQTGSNKQEMPVSANWEEKLSKTLWAKTAGRPFTFFS